MRLTLVVLLALAAPAAADGFYFRVAVGPGYTWGTLNTSPASSASHGANVSTQLAVGWTLRRGLVAGVGTFPMVTPSPKYDGVDAGGQHTSATGPFVDYFFTGRDGWHAHGGLLFALGYLDGRMGNVGFGYGATAGIGYDKAITDHWAIGGIARVTAYHLYDVADDIRMASPALLVSATYR